MADAGKLLKDLRLQAGFGLRRFAELIGMQPSNLSAIEHGHRPFPEDPDKVRRIADALGLVEGSAKWDEFFDAARSEGQFPADVADMADRELVPLLLRTVKNRDLSDEDIRRLIGEFQGGKGGKGDSGTASNVFGQTT